MKLRALLLSASAGLALAGMGAATAASAQQAGDFTFGVGLGLVTPKDDNGTLSAGDLTLGDDTQITLTLEYLLTDNLGLELLAATPFTHDIKLNGAKVGEVEHLPPTVTLNYYFRNDSKFTPFVGAGVNFTTALDVDSPLGDLDLQDSWGLAAHLGLDYALSENNALRTDLRWMDIDMDTSLNGAGLGTAEVDPLVLGVSFVHRF
ncbi:OmpW family protein [Mesobaculum littorinae]|uniref:OmpW family protein n=1 Tax=Mesobaculum littorinae TaxID=2486419 RepID=A0A438AJP6_9RHOB|nr:OmpW family outer membrane protein [Mesobaculum littorinae]RVV98940.1 OmpW family protein [Mesobaculum littorinae]